MNKEEFAHLSVRRTFDQVARRIAQYVIEENLETGDQLPPERKMSDLLQVSRSSVREGLRVLEMMKYVESRHGGGTYVADPPPFLLPAYLLDLTIEEETLDHYFNLSLVMAEQILFSSFGTQLDEPLLNKQDFWFGFSEWVTYLGKRMSNPFFLELWSGCFKILNAHSFYSNQKPAVSLDELINEFVKKDRLQLKSLLSKLGNQKG